MTKYRIVEVTFDSGRREYRVQKRHLFFIWWPMTQCVDGINHYAWFKTYREAMDFVEWQIKIDKALRRKPEVIEKTSIMNEL